MSLDLSVDDRSGNAHWIREPNIFLLRGSIFVIELKTAEKNQPTEKKKFKFPRDEYMIIGVGIFCIIGILLNDYRLYLASKLDSDNIFGSIGLILIIIIAIISVWIIYSYFDKHSLPDEPDILIAPHNKIIHKDEIESIDFWFNIYLS
jgi:amino acid permease